MRIAARRFSSFITTPIFYANGPPHLGHLFTCVVSDAFHRWRVLSSPSSSHVFSTGTDEHGAKIARTARERGMSAEELCDETSESFRRLLSHFDIQHSHFIRTTEQRHAEAASEMWLRLSSSGYIKKGSYRGWYSTVDECFYSDDEVNECGELGKPRKVSKETGSAVEWLEEENYVFTLSEFYEPIQKWLSTADVIRPKQFLPIALSYLRPNEELSISRDSRRLSWGIPVPGDSSQTMYVWLDALVNYLTVVGFPSKEPHPWPPIHIIGKDILKFHAVYWPAFLLAAGMRLPSKLFVHGHWLVNGSKMSKSVGNIIEPFSIAEQLTEEGVRYFLLKQGAPHSDSNFEIVNAIHAINSDLVNNVANLVSRATVRRLNPNQEYPEHSSGFYLEGAAPLIHSISQLASRVQPFFDELLFYKGIEEIMAVAKEANGFFQFHSPWKLAEGEKLSSVLYLTYESARICSLLLQPIAPRLATHSLARLGIPLHSRGLDSCFFGAARRDGIKHLGPEGEVYMKRLQLPK